MPPKSKKRKKSTLSSNRPKKVAKTYQHEILKSQQHPTPYYYHAKRIYLFQTPYIPQYKDHVVFLRQGLPEFYEQSGGNPFNKKMPQELYPNIPPQLECIITDIQYLLVGDDASNGVTLFRLTLDPINDSSTNQEQTSDTFPPFEVDYLEVLGNPDFIIPWGKWKAACKLEKKLRPGTAVEVNFDCHWWTGKVIEVSPSDPKFPKSMWENVLIEWKEGGPSRVSAWEIRDLQYELDPNFKNPLDSNAIKKITTLLDEFVDYKIQILPVLQGAYPIILTIIIDRLKAQYYRQWESFEFELEWIVKNVKKERRPRDIKPFLDLYDKIINIIKDVKTEKSSKANSSSKPSKEKQTKSKKPSTFVKADKELNEKLAGLFDSPKPSSTEKPAEEKETKLTQPKSKKSTSQKKSTSSKESKKKEPRIESKTQIKEEPEPSSKPASDVVQLPSQGGEEEEFYYGEPYGSPPHDETTRTKPHPSSHSVESEPEPQTAVQEPSATIQLKEEETVETTKSEKETSEPLISSQEKSVCDESGEETEESEDEEPERNETGQHIRTSGEPLATSPSITDLKTEPPPPPVKEGPKDMSPPMGQDQKPVSQIQEMEGIEEETEETGEQLTPIGPQLPEEMDIEREPEIDSQQSKVKEKKKSPSAPSSPPLPPPPPREPISFGLNTHILIERKRKKEAEAEERKRKLMKNPMKSLTSDSFPSSTLVLENEGNEYNPIQVMLQVNDRINVCIDENPAYDESLENERNAWIQKFDSWKQSSEWHVTTSGGLYTSKDRQRFEDSIDWHELELPKNVFSYRMYFRAPWVMNSSPLFTKFAACSRSLKTGEQPQPFIYLMKSSSCVPSLAEKGAWDEDDDNYNVRDEIQKIMQQIYGKNETDEEEDQDESELTDSERIQSEETHHANENEDLSIANTERIFPYRLRVITLCVCMRQDYLPNVEESDDAVEMHNLENDNDESPSTEYYNHSTAMKLSSRLQLHIRSKLSDIEKMRLAHLQERVSRYQDIVSMPSTLLQYPQPQEMRQMCERYRFLITSTHGDHHHHHHRHLGLSPHSYSQPHGQVNQLYPSREFHWSDAGFYVVPAFVDEVDNTLCSVIQIVGLEDSLQLSLNHHSLEL
eukprot:gb/GECH01014313.1/.p1 GENE.gb/GECH01014313.1/~~gb/GECH01014313.1/.p1  ORF type:complete len:1117 (+),score=331.37 gb/GECH01014313.1/:1-3351(+)